MLKAKYTAALAEQMPDKLVFKTLKLFPEQLELTLLEPAGVGLPTVMLNVVSEV
jgi:hypothetical protein